MKCPRGVEAILHAQPGFKLDTRMKSPCPRFSRGAGVRDRHFSRYTFMSQLAYTAPPGRLREVQQRFEPGHRTFRDGYPSIH